MIEPSAGQQLDKMITGYWVSQAIYAAAKFGIADHLKDGPRSIDDLAATTSTNSDALYRLLRALASIGIFAEGEPRQFSLTPLAEPLQSDIPGSKRALALMSGDEQFHAWAEIEFSIQTGSTAFERVYGKPIFEYLGEHPDKARIFDAAMVGIHGRESDDILDAYDFSSMRVVADLGGGNGSQIINLLKRYPNLKGILFDLPHVIERAKKQIESAGLTDRCELVGGDFFDAVPNGADAYMMRHIIHDWDDEKSLKGASILVVGVAYKPDVDDIRETPAVFIIEDLIERGACVSYHDPYVQDFPKMRGHDVNLSSVPLDSNTLGGYDAVIIVTDHSNIDWDVIALNASLVIDTRNALACCNDIKARLVKA